MTGPGERARLWLDVPFAEKDEAKAVGIRWDGAARRWYAPRVGMPGLERWAAIPDLLPGEDRSFGAGLFVDLVPASCWFTNVRSCVVQRDWDRLRSRIYARADQRCEVCSAVPDRDRGVRLEAHERWDFLDSTRVQKLRRLICLCNACHEVTHFGFAEVQGNDGRAMTHLMQVNRLSHRQAEQHVGQAFRTWESRSRYDWALDLSMLTGVGIQVIDPPVAEERRGVAGKVLNGQATTANASSTTRGAMPRPDWYADPAGRFPLRWWDGSAWTNWVVQADSQKVLDPAFRG